MCLYITGHLDTVFPAEYRKEILRYLYCHQVGRYVGTYVRSLQLEIWKLILVVRHGSYPS